MEIKIKVEIGLTPAAAALAERLLQPGACTAGTAPQRGTAPNGQREADKPETENGHPEADKSGTDNGQRTTDTRQPEAASPSPEEPEPIEALVPEPVEPPVEHEPGPDGITPPTDREMRDLMDITISRLAGNGWKESNDPKSLAIRKGCTRVFKQIAAHLGAEKPTGLIDEKRTEFCKELDSIYIDTKDNSVEWKPF